MRRLLPTLSALVVILFGSTAGATTARYRLEVENTWSEATHPGAFPPDAHFSWLGGGTHNGDVSFWAAGEHASPGVEEMAETGNTSLLVGEVNAAVGMGDAFAALEWQHWFCPTATTHPSCGPLTVEFDVSEFFPLITLATMLGPSPDWFVGVSALSLRDSSGWVSFLEVPLFPYDAGTISTNAFMLGGVPSNDPITLIDGSGGQLIGPQQIGTFRFVLTPEPGTALLLTVGLAGLALGIRLRS